MSTTPGMHEPTREFRARLEQRIVTRMRRRADTISPRRRGWRRLRAAAVIMAALGIGAAAGALPAQVQESRVRVRLLEALRSELQLSETRAELAQTQLALVRRQHQVGAAGRDALAEAENELARMHAAVERSRLNLEEVQASATPPRDDLTAPLVRGRDYVRERVLLDLNVAQQQLSAVEQLLAETESRNRLGLVSGVVLLEARAGLTRARADMQLLASRLDLRAAFLRDQLKPDEVTRRAHRLELQQAVQIAEAQHRLAEARFAHVRQRAEAGASDPIELLSAELEVARRALELQRLVIQLQMHDGEAS